MRYKKNFMKSKEGISPVIKNFFFNLIMNYVKFII
jgi:hypothetical protein